MAWTTPATAVSNSPLTAATWNATVRDNLNQTAPALASTSGSYFAATGPNAISERIPQVNSTITADTTSSTTYADLNTVAAIPQVTVTSGATALVSVSATMFDSTVNTFSRSSYVVSGASTAAANDALSVGFQSATASALGAASFCSLHTGLTNGSNTFTQQYRCSSGASTATFSNRRLAVLPF